ncbi:MAG: hypothetical protein HQ536_02970, partial [Parcubacteria group bacterium]|nr:hypothetical protein [Parcubacteria group bacterium]
MKALSRKNIFRTLLLISGLVVAFIYITPHIVGFFELKKQGLEYNPMSLEAGASTHFYDEVLVYIPSVREVVEGHFLVRNIDAYEYMSGPIIRHSLSALVLSPFFVIAGSVTGFVVLSDFIFSLVSFLLLFYLFFILTKNKFLSTCASVITALSPKVFLILFPLHLSSLKDLVKHFVPFKIDMWMQDISDLTKMEAIKPGLPFILCFLIFLFLSLKKENKIYTILSGIFLGSLFYIYSFHWLFFSISTVILAIILLYSKQFKEFKKVFLSGLIGVIVSIPFWINYFYLSMMPNYKELSSSIGKEVSRSIRFDLWPEYLLYISLAILIWFLYKKSDKILAFFVISFLATNIVVYNLQVFIGFQFQSNHWATKVIWLNLALVWLLIFNKIFKFCRTKKWRNIFKVICIAIVVVFVFNALVGKLIWASDKYKFWNIPRNQTESFEWLEENTELDSVVMT